jgi:hypothetical protein
MSKETVVYGKASHSIAINIRASNGGSFIAPASPPAVTHVHVNGVIASADSITIAQMQDSTPANLTGRYLATLDLTATGFNSQINDTLIINFETVVQGHVVGETVVISVDAAQIDKPSLEAQ